MFVASFSLSSGPDLMSIQAILPTGDRDLRLDFFRGIANWWIFLDYIPHNVLDWITPRNYGFSDAADLFVFVSGYTASFVYARVMLDRGFFLGSTRLFKRAWQLYVAYILLFVVYVAAIGFVAERWNVPEIINEFNVSSLFDNPIQTIFEGLILKFRPANLDLLPLYVVIVALFPAALWCLLRKPDLTMVGSIVLYFAARHFGWNLPAYPEGVWYFNPFAWQLLFMFGAWFALGGALDSRAVIRSRALIWIAAAYLLFALVMTLAGKFASFGALFPDWLFKMFNPNDKTNLAPYRVIHFVIIAFLITRFIPRDWEALETKWFRPAIVCGQHSLEVFCGGLFLAFVAHSMLILHSGFLMQIFVSVAGIALMCVIAYFREWWQRLDKAPPRRVEESKTPLRQPAPVNAPAQEK